MHATMLPVASVAVTIDEPLILTERGEKMLGLIRCQEALPGGWPALSAELDRRIAELIADGDAS